MKFSCNTCSTKYSLPDHLVDGRTLRVQCKRCAKALVIDGAAGVARARVESTDAARAEKRSHQVSGEVSVADSAPAAPKFKSARGETSLLFQIEHLSAPIPGAPVAQPVDGEGSGLLDMRSMSQAYLDARDAGNASVDDASRLRTPPWSQPPIVAPRPEREGPSRLMVGSIGTAGMLAVLGVVFAIVMIDRSVAGQSRAEAATAEIARAGSPAPSAVSETLAVASPVEKPPAASPASAPEAPAPASTPESSPPAVSPAVAKPVAATQPSREPPAAASRPRTPREPQRSSVEPREPARREPSQREPATTSDAGGSCMDEFACALAANPPACCTRYRADKPKAPEATTPRPSQPDSSLPKSLERAQISTAMRTVSGRVSACASRHSGSGQVHVKIAVSGAGKVTSATIEKTPSEPLGACVAKQVAYASFPKSQNGATFTYPFVFR